ncbi:hypothetical protein SOVF_097150 [Spinacia oleracea]|nr:hypothetical protein SOVF_097150 [Spinacia oleracea]
MLKYAYGKYLGLVDYLHRTGLAKKCAGLRMGAKVRAFPGFVLGDL